MAPKQRPGRSTQNYATPDLFIQAVKARFDITHFVMDLAAGRRNTKALKFFTEEDDALRQTWPCGGWNWLNPPYAHLGDWVEKAYTEALRGVQTLMLVPASVGANWWRDWVHEKASVLFLNGRLAFMPDKPKWLYPKDCVLLVYESPRTIDNDNLYAPKWYDVWDWKPDPGRCLSSLCPSIPVTGSVYCLVHAVSLNPGKPLTA